MAADAALLAELVPVVRAFVHTRRLPSSCMRSEGRVVLTVDGRLRVHVNPAPFDRVALQADVVTLLEQDERHMDELLLKLCEQAAGLLLAHGSTLAIDRKREALVLQQSVPRNADLRVLEEALADFANALDFWRSMCRAEMETPRGAIA
jgi:hypothetical protein